MGRRCCVAGCNSTSRLPEHIGVTYHSFPLDHNMRAIWIRNTRLSSIRQITKSVLVCSRHFRRADFQPQRRGKYLLKQKVFPTVFPWGKLDPARLEADLKRINSTSRTPIKAETNTSAAEEEDTKATVAATVAQIMAQTAELNAAAGLKSSKPDDDAATDSQEVESNSTNVKFEAITSFSPGARLEAQDFDGIWHTARVVEVDNDEREVLIKFEKAGKNKSSLVGTEEWIPMNSTRLRQRISTKVTPAFALEEKCMARWSGPRKFPGTVKKILPNDSYEVLFDDGYTKNVRAIHMTKIQSEVVEEGPSTSTDTQKPSSSVKRSSSNQMPTTSNKKRSVQGSRRNWPLLDMSKLDIASLNLPEVPRDGEWTCHWVNDQPIGREGYLVVGDHRKPTVIVDDWRLPPGWVKHMYQRSNVLGKWDVILVTPSGKRFRSKCDLKSYLENRGEVYNPDIYDFSIHRRRAKDINCYAYTPDYVPQFASKSKTAFSSSTPGKTATKDAFLSNLSPSGPFLNSPIAEAIPPIELLTNTVAEDKNITHVDSEVPKQLLESADASSTPTPTSTPTALNKDDNMNKASTSHSIATIADGKEGEEYAYIGDLKVQIIDNLFRCPQEGCSKNFRKENHLQIHVKHYHQNLNKLLGSCPKMQELAEKRTHPGGSDTTEPTPKNQIPNQQFFAKLHQQDLDQTRSRSRSVGIAKHQHDSANGRSPTNIALEESSDADSRAGNESNAGGKIVSLLDESNEDDDVVEVPVKRSRFAAASKRQLTSRRSNRQRTARRYITAHKTNAATLSVPSLITAEETNYDNTAGLNRSRDSLSASRDDHKDKSLESMKSGAMLVSEEDAEGGTESPEGSVESDVSQVSDEMEGAEATDESERSDDSDAMESCTASNSSSNESEAESTHYIKENGEIIKIVSMRQEEIINCICGYGEENGLMIQCDLCLCWQHGFCNGIDKESDVPEKYVCYICRHPERGRSSLLFKHDQDWLFDGKLPSANFHTQNEGAKRRAEFLQKSHTLTGNLLELKEFMHSLRVKINIANNKCHPKLYLWANKWDDEESTNTESGNEVADLDAASSSSPSKQSDGVESTPAAEPTPTIPQPEAPIDPTECQERLLEHIKVQQELVMERLKEIEAAVEELEQEDNLPDLKDAGVSTTKDVLATFVKELDIVQRIAKLNKLEENKSS